MVEGEYWVWTAKETAELKVEKLDDPADDEVLIRTRYTGISPGTEMALYMMTHVGFSDPKNRYAKYPHRGGYLNIGIVEKAGKDVSTEWPEGTWVFSAAGHCRYSLAKPSSLTRLHEQLHKPEAAFLGMARIGYAAVFLAPAALCETVAVLGAGLVGNFAAQIYEATGANVVSVERDAFRAAIACKCGLATVSSLDEVESYFGAAPSLVIEATGVPALCVEAFKLAAERGRVVILSSPRGEAPVNFYSQIHAKLIKVIGAHARSVTSDPNAIPRMVTLALKGRLDLADCLTHMESWKDAPKVWDVYAHGPKERLGTVFDWEK